MDWPRQSAQVNIECARDKRCRMSQWLIENNFVEATGDLVPLMSNSGRQTFSVGVEALVQHSKQNEGLVAASGSHFGHTLKYEHILVFVALRCVFEQFAKLVDDEQYTRSISIGPDCFEKALQTSSVARGLHLSGFIDQSSERLWHTATGRLSPAQALCNSAGQSGDDALSRSGNKKGDQITRRGIKAGGSKSTLGHPIASAMRDTAYGDRS